MPDWLKDAIKNEYIKLFEYGSFENKKWIGEGGFGSVFGAYSKSINQTIALKRLHQNVIYNEDSFHKFIKEVKIISKIGHNMNIIQFFGITK
ncbi:9530_t:CDS:2, partial [Dentiscutata heterogama]